MTTIHTIILSIIEGITEFLPISSTGHMILAGEVLSIPNTTFTKSFEIIIQLGAIMAVVVLYAKTLLKNFDLIKKTLVAFIPTAIIGLVFYKIIKTYLLGNVWVVISSLFIGGIVLILFERKLAKNTQPDESPITYKNAFIIGLAQSVAMIPGVSRSAATIVGGQLLGLSRRQIVEFSFILAIPTMAAATILDLYKNYQLFTSADLNQLALGFAVSFIVALLAIKSFLKYIQKHNLTSFGWYRIVLAIISFIVFIKI
jgi:undecaprenyl-diphosphatase